MLQYTSCCCPVAVDIRDSFYLNTSRFAMQTRASAACQHSEVKWTERCLNPGTLLHAPVINNTTKQLKSKELAPFERPVLYFLFLLLVCLWFFLC